MTSTLTASYPNDNLSGQQSFRRPHQSILPLRREQTIINGSLTRNRDSKPIYSDELPKRSAAFSAGRHNSSIYLSKILSFNNVEKQYNRRQSSTQIRSAKSDEVDIYLRALNLK